MSDFNFENGVDLSDLKPVAVERSKGPIAGETVFQRYLRVSKENLDLSIKEARGRFDENDPTYAPYERPVKSKNWKAKNPKKAGPDDKIEVWVTVGGKDHIALTTDKDKDGNSVKELEVLGRDVVTALERFKAFLSHPDFEKSAYGQTFSDMAKKINQDRAEGKKKKSL
jgi:hypothetical protein